MDLRNNVTKHILNNSPIPENKKNKDNDFYYKNYEDNLFCKLGKKAKEAYKKGSGGETKPTKRTIKGNVIEIPAKMASIVSSSALTFNLLGNDPAVVMSDKHIPQGEYDVAFEKKMFTLKRGGSPANLDAFLSDSKGKNAVFCEMKFLEWLTKPGDLNDAYLDESRFFEPDNSAVDNPVDAYKVFKNVIEKLNEKKWKYDVWQMLKHIIAIYNSTSYVTASSVKNSMAGLYEKIYLLNIVNEFPPQRIEDEEVRKNYENSLNNEKEQAEEFVDIIEKSGIIKLFKNNCKATFCVKYISAKDFAAEMKMSEDKKNYLKRYF